MVEDSRVGAYARMAEHTLPVCLNECKGVHPVTKCCDAMYCQMAEEWAREKYGVTLAPVGFHPTLKFMGPQGCTVAPHLRPLCTLHSCPINAVGFKKGPGGAAWTEQYFALREGIDKTEEEALHQLRHQ